MMRDPAYDEILDTNRELRNELAIEVANNKAQEEKIRALSRELERPTEAAYGDRTGSKAQRSDRKHPR
ncbi:unnamed protein product [Rhizophagus irregularis]|nr:unnamed protein product [Rhizophagus irregularis]